MQDAHITDGDAFSHEVLVDLNMLGVLMLNEVGGEVDSADVIVVDECAPGEWTVKLLEQQAQPTLLSHTVGNRPILRLSTRARDDVLTLGGPGGKVVAEEHNVVRGGLTCIWATYPINISVDDKLEGGGGAP